MKKLILSITLLCSIASAQTVGQFELRKRTSTGFTSYGITSENGKAIGFTAGVPAMITVGGTAAFADITGAAGDNASLAAALALKSPLASPTFTGTVTIPSGASISGYLTTAAAALAYQPLDADLTSIAALASSAGVLTNNGSGTYSYTAIMGALPSANSLVKWNATGSGINFNDAEIITLGTIQGSQVQGSGAPGTLAFQEYDGDMTLYLSTTSTGYVESPVTPGNYEWYWPSNDGSLLTDESGLPAANLSGTVATARLGTGTADSSTYLRGDGTWATAGGGITIGTTAITGGTSGRLLTSGTTVGEQTLGTGVSTWLATPTLANINAVVSDADLATLSANTFTGAQTVIAAINAATPTAAVSLVNSTAATSGSQKASPSLVLRGNGYGTTGSASQTVDVLLWALPVQGTAPTATATLQSSINGAAATSLMTVDGTSLYLGTGAGANVNFGNSYNGGTYLSVGANASNLQTGGVQGHRFADQYVTNPGYTIAADVGTSALSITTAATASTARTNAASQTWFRDGAGTWQAGIDNATTPTNQTIKAHDVTTGTGSALDLRGGNGSTSGGAVTISTSATTTPTVRMTIKASGIINVSNVPTSSAGLSTGDIYQTAGALMIVP